MIVVHDIFHLKFGKARDAKAIFAEMKQQIEGSEFGSVRLLSNFTGEAYTFVMESTFPDLGTYERVLREGMADSEWQANYQRFIPLVESGERVIFSVVE